MSVRRYELAIKHNNCASNDPCAICGRRTDPAVGPELFLADGYRLVCWECGEEHDPDMVAMLRTHRAWATTYYVREPGQPA